MASVRILGSSFTIISTVTKADLKVVKEYRPTALVLTDPETKEAVFQVDIGSNSLSTHGVSFGGVANTEVAAEQFATATFNIPEGVENARDYVLDVATQPLTQLNKIEAGIAAVLQAVKAERDAIQESITIAV